MCCGKSRTWQGGRGDEEEGRIYCLLMRAFDVAPLFAVCTPGSLRLHSDWLSGGGVVGGWATRHFPGNTFQSAAAAAWRGKAVKAARPLCLPPSNLRCILPHPHPSYSPAWPPDSAGRHWLPLWGPSRHYELPRALRQWWYLPVEQEMSVALQLLLNRASIQTQVERWVKQERASSSWQ